MMTRWLKGCRLLFAGMLLVSAAAAAVEDPQQMLRATADKVLAEVSARKAELEADPAKIYPLVESTVLPHFDFRAMSQSAMARHWRTASEAQRDSVTTEFRELLVRTYATALLSYSGQQIEYLPVRYAPADTDVKIATRIATDGAPPVPIDYRLHVKDGRWLVYDVVIDGVSLITNYRGQFNGVVQRKGVDGLIATMANMNRPASGQ